MPELMPIPVSRGDTIYCRIVMPESAPIGCVLNCKGVGIYTWDNKNGEKSGFYGSALREIEKEIIGQGFAMAYVSPKGYSEKNSLSINKFVRDVEIVSGRLKDRFGVALFAMGHSLGAYSMARLMLTTSHHPFTAVALLSPPISLSEAVNGFAETYTRLPQPVREIVARAFFAGVAVKHRGSAAAVLDEAMTQPPFDDLVISGEYSGNSSSTIAQALIVYGRKDPYLFPHAMVRFSMQQSWEQYEKRWRLVAPNSKIKGYDGVGHHFTTGFGELVKTALLHHQNPEAKGIATEIINHFKSSLEKPVSVN